MPILTGSAALAAEDSAIMDSNPASNITAGAAGSLAIRTTAGWMRMIASARRLKEEITRVTSPQADMARNGATPRRHDESGG